jgi:hypothetical protein
MMVYSDAKNSHQLCRIATYFYARLDLQVSMCEAKIAQNFQYIDDMLFNPAVGAGNLNLCKLIIGLDWI